MSLAYDASGVLDLCERVFRNDLELDCERSNERNTVRAKVSIGGTRYTIVCSAMEKAQVLHLWAFLPFDVESEEKANTPTTWKRTWPWSWPTATGTA